MAFRWVAPQKTMPNTVGSINGATPGRHLVLNGHIDVFLSQRKGGLRLFGAVRSLKIKYMATVRLT